MTDSYDWEAAWNKPERKKFDDFFTKPEPPAGTIPPATVNGASAYGKAALEKELAILAACGPDSHKRNDQLNISAFKLSQLVASGHLPEKETWDQLRATVLRNGLPVGETDGTLRSAFRAGLQQPRVVPELKPKIHSAWEPFDNGQHVNTDTGEVTPLEQPGPNVTEAPQTTNSGDGAYSQTDDGNALKLITEHRRRLRRVADMKKCSSGTAADGHKTTMTGPSAKPPEN